MRREPRFTTHHEVHAYRDRALSPRQSRSQPVSECGFGTSESVNGIAPHLNVAGHGGHGSWLNDRARHLTTAVGCGRDPGDESGRCLHDGDGRRSRRNELVRAKVMARL